MAVLREPHGGLSGSVDESAGQIDQLGAHGSGDGQVVGDADVAELPAGVETGIRLATPDARAAMPRSASRVSRSQSCSTGRQRH